MEYIYLPKIDSPADLKQLPVEVLPQVCEEVRDFIIQNLSKNPGHLGSSLGTVELTVALHYVFSTPEDRIVWDVGHQAYAHKILTGRRDRFHTNRQFHGLSPFVNPAESEYDAFISGHASNSISAALGMDVANNFLQSQEQKRHVVAVIGDGAMTGGLAFEGLNNTSMDKNDLLIVLNDNNMAIDPIKGGFTEYLLDLTTSERYNRIRWNLYQLAVKLHMVDEHKKNRIKRFSTNIKTVLSHQSHNLFQGLSLRYFGPADGHNVIDLVRILSEIKNHRGPKVLHIVTTKGKGYAPAENNQTIWHAPGEFDVETGERKGGKGGSKLWQEVFGETLLSLAKENDRVVGITPAMPSGCSMNIMQRELPDRVFDVGIAEGHAVTFSAGLAKEGMVPFCNIYSSFLQRSYDNIIHDVALPNLHVVLCIDRAGIVGNDGATHHGLFDLSYLRPIPNLTIGAPMTGEDLEAMMRLAAAHYGPIAIRYPRGKAQTPHPPTGGAISFQADDTLQIGKARLISPLVPQRGRGTEERSLAVLSIGAIGNTVVEAINLLQETTPPQGGRGVMHYDMRWLKPIDTEVLDYVGTHFDRVVTVEDGVISGGLGSAVLEYFADHGYTARVIRLGINDQFVEHGSTAELYHMLHLDKEGICESLLQALEK